MESKWLISLLSVLMLWIRGLYFNTCGPCRAERLSAKHILANQHEPKKKKEEQTAAVVYTNACMEWAKR